jgi:hypothetical protein
VRWGLIKASAGLAVAVVVLASCSDKEPGSATGPTQGSSEGTPTTTTTRGSTSTSGGGANGAPKVNAPLDASKYLPQPCTALSAAALQSFNISKPGTPDVDSELAKTAGPSCSWTNDAQPVQFGYNVGFLTGNKNGLSDTYRGRARFKYFEPTEVDGYPAVFNDGNDFRANGVCNLTIGISDTLAFRVRVSFTRDEGTKSCDETKKLASAVIQTLKGA